MVMMVLAYNKTTYITYEMFNILNIKYTENIKFHKQCMHTKCVYQLH